MANADRFFSMHQHGFVRVAAATPLVELADPQSNARACLELLADPRARHVDLMLFPELGLSAYSIDDLFLQDAVLDAVDDALARLVDASKDLATVFIVGAPLRRESRVYNCGVVIARNAVLGVVPKSFLPNYREFYENRWFAPGAGLEGLDIDVAGRRVPFGTDLVFAASDLADFTFHVEICEDLWAPSPPSTRGALAGAHILCNLSASNVVVGKSDARRMLCASQSMRCQSAYVYAAAGPGESTNDLAWDGQASIHELGELLTESARFPRRGQICVADVDVGRIRSERMRTSTFNNAAVLDGHPERRFRRIAFVHRPAYTDCGLERVVERFPFVPSALGKLDQDCYEAFNIQVHGLVKRLQATKRGRVVLGISGGLDSAHALVVAAKAFDTLGLPRRDILGFTMPGFATSSSTKGNAWSLMNALAITGEEIDIRAAATQLLRDIGHPYASGAPVYDVTFENVQAGLRTDYLFRLANQRDALVLGTGDLSELALGWCTYGVGDQMSHYNVNGGIAKTLIQYLLRRVATTGQFDDVTADTLRAILDTEISPELVPASADGRLQSSQTTIGPYELQDLNLFYVTRFGMRPSKIAFLAWHAWHDREIGTWPHGFPEGRRNAYGLDEIRRWLRVFLHRFFELSQFKRSALPNGPKVVSGGSLSPRGDWRAPSDGNARVWLDELEQGVPGGEASRSA